MDRHLVSCLVLGTLNTSGVLLSPANFLPSLNLSSLLSTVYQVLQNGRERSGKRLLGSDKMISGSAPAWCLPFLPCCSFLELCLFVCLKRKIKKKIVKKSVEKETTLREELNTELSMSCFVEIL